MYSVLFLFTGGVALVSANWPIMALSIIAIAMLAARIPKEEAMMLGRFGDTYRQYIQRAGRLLPRV